MINCCPCDKQQCQYCEDWCQRLKQEKKIDLTAEAIHIAQGLGWMGFWIAVGLIVMASLWK